MASPNSLTCPECGAVLRPAKPLRPGKSVKCPKCGAGFVVGEDQPRPVEKRTASPVQTKPSGGGIPVAPVTAGDEDEEGGLYAFRGDENFDAPEVNYAPELEIKDLRGPAMKEVVDPSNKLILVGVTGFLGWVAFLVTLVIPIMFPLETKEQREKARQQKIQEISMRKGLAPGQVELPEEMSFLTIGKLDLASLGEWHLYASIPCLLPMVLGMIYSFILCIGAVKIQNLESREWGIAASVMAMIPLNAGGLLCFLALILNIVLNLLFEDWFKWAVLVFFLICAWGTNLAVGIWMLTVLNKPAVIAGYEYVPE
jgi:hypothetical protein